MITVESTEKEFHMAIPRGEMDPAQTEAILLPIRFTSLVAGSAMSQGEAMRLAEESKADWWEKNQDRFARADGARACQAPCLPVQPS